MSTGFRETNMGYTFSPVGATMGIITSQRHERLQVGSDYQHLKRAVVWKRLPDQSCGLWWRDIPSQSDSVWGLMGDKYSLSSFLLTSDLLLLSLDAIPNQKLENQETCWDPI